MAKSQFQRVKPHVNVGTLYQRIRGLGFTSLGATQIVNGERVTDPDDRRRIGAALTFLAQGRLRPSMARWASQQLSAEDIIRAWKDEDFRRGLTDEQRAQLPEHPSGVIEIQAGELDRSPGARDPLRSRDFTAECTYEVGCHTYPCTYPCRGWRR